MFNFKIVFHFYFEIKLPIADYIFLKEKENFRSNIAKKLIYTKNRSILKLFFQIKLISLLKELKWLRLRFYF